MFKPTLKRSILQMSSPYNQSNYCQQTPSKNWQRFKTTKDVYKSLSTLIIPPTLCNGPSSQVKGPIFNPLNFCWHQYPQAVTTMLNTDSFTELIAKDIGIFYELFWCFNGMEILIWRQASRQQKRFRLPEKTEIVAFGQLENASLHFKNKNPIILAAGIQNYLHLFGLDRETLVCYDYKLCYQIANSSYIQKIVFVSKNQIAICSNTGQHYLFDFKGELKVIKPYITVLHRTLPYLPLLFPQKQHYCEKVQSLGNYIFSLVREEKKANWFSFKAKQLINQFTGNYANQQWITQSRKVQIYQIDRTALTISLIHTITEADLQNKIRASSIISSQTDRHNFCQRQNDYWRIATINIQQKSSIILEIVTRFGNFIQIDVQQGFTICSEPLTVPTRNSLEQVGLFLKKDNKKYQQLDIKSRCITSLGTNSLTLLEDSLWYMSQSEAQVIKSGGVTGTLHKKKANIFGNNQWVLLTGKGYFNINRVKPKDILIVFLSIKTNIDDKNINKRWMDETNFQLFLNSISNSIGQQNIIESLIQCLLEKQTEIRLNKYIFSFIKDHLQNVPAQNYRDWNYQLISQKRPNKNQETIQIDSKMKQQLWSLIFRMQNKVAKYSQADPNTKGILGSAYWQAVKNIFYKITKDLMVIRPIDMKSSKLNIQKAIKLLDRLSDFFNVKRQKQIVFLDTMYIKRRQRKQQSQDLFSLFKKKQCVQSGSKKLEESTQTQAEKYYVESKHITQSSRALQRDINQATFKIKALIEVFMCLTDVSESQQMPSVAGVLKFKSEQIKVKLKILGFIFDREKILQLDSKLPELLLKKDLNLLIWIENIKAFKWLDAIDLKQVSGWLSSTYFNPVLQVFSERADLQINLLLNYWAKCAYQINLSSQNLQLQSKRITIYSEDTKRSLTQDIHYYNKQQQLMLQLIQSKITKSINNYINSDESNYSRYQTILNAIIQLVTSHNEQSLNSFLQLQLVKTKVTQKILLFKRLKPQPKPSLTIEDYLMTREAVKRTITNFPRENLSNYDAYLADSIQ